jgi:putative transposase
MSWNDLRTGRFSQPDQIYFITFVTHQRKPLFTDVDIAKLFCHQLHNFQTTYHDKWLTWVLMPDHFHGLLQLSDTPLASVIQRIKSKTAIAINKKLNRKGIVWQHAYYDNALRREDDVKQISRYIVANPLRAKLVNKIGHYPFWDSVYLQHL